MANKKGPSRRMQKQGPPPSLDELFNSKKRKLGAPQKGAVKKQRTQQTAPAVRNAVNGLSRPTKASVGNKSANGDSKESQKGRAPRKPELVLDKEDDEDGDAFSDLSGDGIDDPDIVEDELDGIEEADLNDLDDD